MPCKSLIILALCVFVLPVSAQTETDGQPVVADAFEAVEAPARANLGEANEFVRSQDWAGADGVLVTLQEEYPDDPALLLMRGEVLLALRKPADAASLLKRSAELDPERKRTHFQLGSALAASGNRSGALTAFAKEIELQTAAEESEAQILVLSRLNRSMLLVQQNRWDDAAAEMEAVLILEPERVAAYGDLASVYLEAGNLDKAAKTLQRGSDKGFKSANHYYNLGARYYRKATYPSAIEALTRALELDPLLASAERSLAASLDKLGRDAESMQHLRRYLELRPEAPDKQEVQELLEAGKGR